MEEDIQIRGLTTEDLQAVSTIHCKAFPESALTNAGVEVTQRYYQWQLLGPHDVVALAAIRGTELLGFCFGGVFRGAMSGFLHKNRVFLTIRILTHPWLVLNPLFRERIGLVMRILQPRKARTVSGSESAADHKSFAILSIAVDPKQQGLGIGKLLMTKVETIARQQGFQQMRLTVHPTNHQAVEFYQRLGWEKNLMSDIWGGSMDKSLQPTHYD